LDPIIGHGNAAIVVVAIRIIQTGVEILLAGLGVLILKRMGDEQDSATKVAKPLE
jgi:hypothetical protein